MREDEKMWASKKPRTWGFLEHLAGFEPAAYRLGVKRVVSQQAQIVQWDMAERRYLGTF